MKHSGTVPSFDEATGHGTLKPQNGGSDLGFERSAMLWDQMVSPRLGLRLSYQLSGKNRHASAVDLQTILSLPNVSARKAFTVFRSAAEEIEAQASHDDWDNEGGHMSSTDGHVVSTPGADLPYKVILKHGELAETERPFATMHESEAFIARNTPSPLARSTLRDRPCPL
jgi:cold shock CspA family protein